MRWVRAVGEEERWRCFGALVVVGQGGWTCQDGDLHVKRMK